MATVTVANDNGEVQLIIGIDNSETGECEPPSGDVVFCGNDLGINLVQIHLTKAILDALHEVRRDELRPEATAEPMGHAAHCEVIGDHEQRLMHLEAHLPKQGWVPPVATQRSDETQAITPTQGHNTGCYVRYGVLTDRAPMFCGTIHEHAANANDGSARPNLHIVPLPQSEVEGQHVAACHQSADQNIEGRHRLWHDPAEGCTLPDEHPNWRQ